MWIEISIPIIILLIILVKIKVRGYFWKARNGNKLNFKEFIKEWGKGIEGITPIQQTRTSLIGMIPILTGTVLGLVMTFIGEMYWVSLILYGSMPILLMQLTSTYQKYKKQKIIEDTMKQLNKEEFDIDDAIIEENKNKELAKTTDMVQRIRNGEFRQ